MKVFATIIACVFLVSSRANAQPGAEVAEFPFQYREGLIWVEVCTPKCAQPLNFLLDSGAEVSTIDLHAAQRLNLKWGRPVSVRGVQSDVTGYWPEHPAARLGEVGLPKDFLAVDLTQLSQACGGGVDGLLGADFFRGRRLQIDFKRGKIRFLNSISPTAGEESIPMQVRSSGLLVKIRVNNGKEQKVRLDTGCASPLQWVSSKVPSETCGRQIAVGMTRLAIPLIHTSVRVGAIDFKSVPTGLQDRPIFPGEAGLLGTPLLARFAEVTVDTVDKRLILRNY